MSEKSVGERIAAIGRRVPPEAWDDFDAAHLEYEQLKAENGRLRKIETAARRVVETYREEDPWIDPTPLFEDITWLGDALDQHASSQGVGDNTVS